MLTFLAVLLSGAGMVGAFVYVWFIKKQMTVAAQAMGKDAKVAQASNFGAWLWVKIDGWKTHILAGLIALFQGAHAVISNTFHLVDAATLQAWQQLPWAHVFDATVANAISIICAFLIPITKSMGYAKAATTVPANPPQP